jgi:hypothetical protein
MFRKITSRVRITIFAILAIAFFGAVAYKFRFVEFRFSILELMFLLLGMFTLAVALMYWKIIHPISKKLGKKDLEKIFG